MTRMKFWKWFFECTGYGIGTSIGFIFAAFTYGHIWYLWLALAGPLVVGLETWYRIRQGVFKEEALNL